MRRIGALVLVTGLGLLRPLPGAAEAKGQPKPVLVLEGFKKIEILEDGKVFVAIRPGGRVDVLVSKGTKAQGRIHADGRFVGPRGRMALRLLPDGQMALIRDRKSVPVWLRIESDGRLTSLKGTWPPLVIGADGALAGGSPKSAKQTARIKVRGARSDASRRLAMFVLAALLSPVELSPPPPPAKK